MLPMLVAYGSNEHTRKQVSNGGGRLQQERATYQRALHSPPAT